MGNANTPRRAAAICQNCGSARSVRIGPEGDIRPIGTGLGTDCTCEDGEFRVLSDDPELLTDLESNGRTGEP